METFAEYRDIITTTLGQIIEAKPGIERKYFLGGTCPVSLNDLGHAVSMDLDFHTKAAFDSPTQDADAMKSHFKKKLTWFESDHDFGIYRGAIQTNKSVKGKPLLIEVDLFSNYEDTFGDDLVVNNPLSKFPVQTLGLYLRQKAQCLEERDEAKDMYHLYCLAQKPGWGKRVNEELSQLDPAVLARSKALFPEEWPEIAPSIRCVSGMAPLNTQKLMKWVENIKVPGDTQSGLEAPALCPALSVGAGSKRISR